MLASVEYRARLSRSKRTSPEQPSVSAERNASRLISPAGCAAGCSERTASSRVLMRILVLEEERTLWQVTWDDVAFDQVRPGLRLSPVRMVRGGLRKGTGRFGRGRG